MSETNVEEGLPFFVAALRIQRKTDGKRSEAGRIIIGIQSDLSLFFDEKYMVEADCGEIGIPELRDIGDVAFRGGGESVGPKVGGYEGGKDRLVGNGYLPEHA